MTKEPMVSRTVLMPVDLYRRIADYARFLGRRRCDSWWRRIFLMSEKQWKVLLAVVLVAVSLVVGFIVGTTVVPSTSSTVYSTDPQQCPTDATFCESVNVFRTRGLLPQTLLKIVQAPNWTPELRFFFSIQRGGGCRPHPAFSLKEKDNGYCISSS